MKVGIFAKTWTSCHTLEGIFRAAFADGIESFQFNMCLAGGETIPKKYDISYVDQIADLSRRYNIELAAMSGTFNLLDQSKFKENLTGIENLCRICNELSIPIITICTGTLSHKNMWTNHPDNGREHTWRHMKRNLAQVLAVAQEYQMKIGIEPEISNVVSSPEKAIQLINEMDHTAIKIVMDAANIFYPGADINMSQRIKEAIILLRDHIALVHAKDCEITNKIAYKAAGKGKIDFRKYICCLKEAGYDGSVILHGLSESEVLETVQYLKRQIL